MVSQARGDYEEIIAKLIIKSARENGIDAEDVLRDRKLLRRVMLSELIGRTHYIKKSLDWPQIITDKYKYHFDKSSDMVGLPLWFLCPK